MYVAVTRARKRLYLSHAQTRMLHGQTRYCVASAFLEELPVELLRKVGHVPAFSAGAVPYKSGQANTSSGAGNSGYSTSSKSEAAAAGGFRIGQSVQQRQIRGRRHCFGRRAWHGCAGAGQFRFVRDEVAGA